MYTPNLHIKKAVTPEKTMGYGFSSLEKILFYNKLTLGACYSLAGREKEAQAEAAEILRINPNYSLERLAKTDPTKNQVAKKQFIDALRKAGLK